MSQNLPGYNLIQLLPGTENINEHFNSARFSERDESEEADVICLSLSFKRSNILLLRTVYSSLGASIAPKPETGCLEWLTFPYLQDPSCRLTSGSQILPPRRIRLSKQQLQPRQQESSSLRLSWLREPPLPAMSPPTPTDPGLPKTLPASEETCSPIIDSLSENSFHEGVVELLMPER